MSCKFPRRVKHTNFIAMGDCKKTTRNIFSRGHLFLVILFYSRSGVMTYWNAAASPVKKLNMH